MKLVASTLAALSLTLFVGCATDNDGEGGGHAVGMRPAKPSLDDQKPPVPQNQTTLDHIWNGGLSMDMRAGLDSDKEFAGAAEIVKPPFPIEGLCEVCDDGVLALPNPRNPNELSIIDDVGNFFCKIWVTRGTNGSFEIEMTDCR